MNLHKAQATKCSKKCKQKSAAGPDNIPYEFIKELPSECTEIILKLFNTVYEQNKIPDSWKHALVLPILKPDKPPNDPTSYRPISLSSCI